MHKICSWKHWRVLYLIASCRSTAWINDFTGHTYKVDSTSFDRDMSGRFISHPRAVLSHGVGVLYVRGSQCPVPVRCACACAWLRGALTEAGKAPRVQSDWTILLVIACRSQSRLVGKLIRYCVCAIYVTHPWITHEPWLVRNRNVVYKDLSKRMQTLFMNVNSSLSNI